MDIDHNHNKPQPQVTKKIPLLDASSRSIEFLQKLNLFPSCFSNEIVFKQLIGHLMLTVCVHPYNAALILNLSIPLSMYRSVMMNKFRKLDHILSIVIKPLDLTHKSLATRYKNCHYKDIVAHYTRYHYIIQQDEQSIISGRFIRKNVLGQNSNLDQFLCAIRDHLACDHNQFLTTTAPQLTTSDVDLLCSRYFCICEALTTFEFGNEILVDESRYYRDILQYLTRFIAYCFKIHHARHSQFDGLNSDHLKLLIAGTVLLEIGLRKRQPVYRLQLNMKNITKQKNECLEKKLRLIDMNTVDKSYFQLIRQVVDRTPGAKNPHFRKDIEKHFQQMYQLFKHFFMQNKAI
eukprot:276453_1